MCGRYATGKLTWEAYRDWLDLGAPSGELVPTWNLKPTQAAPIVRLGENGAREVALARWGLIPRFFRKSLKEWRASTFNARIETAATAASFRASWKDRRCLVPAIGWYEWTGLKGARVPYFFQIETNAPGLCFAGLWDRSHPDGDSLDSFTILTTEPNATAADYHDRMPVVLTEEGYGPWLRGESDAPQQVGAARLKVHRVAPLKGDGPELIEPDEG